MQSFLQKWNLKSSRFWISFFIANPYIFLAVVIVMLLAMLLLMILTPILVFSGEDAFDLDFPGSIDWWQSPAHIDGDGTAYTWPVPYVRYVTSKFGERRGGEVHLGIDIADLQGASYTAMQPVYTMAGGEVVHAGAATGYGQAIYIDHGAGLLTKYGHLESLMFVKSGDKVEKGQLIGRIGRGRVGTSSGPHLHFQVESHGVPQDPLSYVKPPSDYTPDEISYRKWNVLDMQKWLEQRNSALADVSILTVIERAGQGQNVDPRLLIAITGQEQSFVPAKNPQADLIVGNPWNVFGCWCSGKGAELSTGEAAEIAAKTIVKLSQNRPGGIDAIQWLNHPGNPNGVYAEHRGWWLGVTRFYQAIRDAVGEE